MKDYIIPTVFQRKANLLPNSCTKLPFCPVIRFTYERYVDACVFVNTDSQSTVTRYDG